MKRCISVSFELFQMSLTTFFKEFFFLVIYRRRNNSSTWLCHVQYFVQTEYWPFHISADYFQGEMKWIVLIIGSQVVIVKKAVIKKQKKKKKVNNKIKRAKIRKRKKKENRRRKKKKEEMLWLETFSTDMLYLAENGIKDPQTWRVSFQTKHNYCCIVLYISGLT